MFKIVFSNSDWVLFFPCSWVIPKNPCGGRGLTSWRVMLLRKPFGAKIQTLNRKNN